MILQKSLFFISVLIKNRKTSLCLVLAKLAFVVTRFGGNFIRLNVSISIIEMMQVSQIRNEVIQIDKSRFISFKAYYINICSL